MKGTNKSSVLRDMIKDHNDLINERDTLESINNQLLFEMKKNVELLEQKQSEIQTKRRGKIGVFKKESGIREENNFTKG